MNDLLGVRNLRRKLPKNIRNYERNKEVAYKVEKYTFGIVFSGRIVCWKHVIGTVFYLNHIFLRAYYYLTTFYKGNVFWWNYVYCRKRNFMISTIRKRILTKKVFYRNYTFYEPCSVGNRFCRKRILTEIYLKISKYFSKEYFTVKYFSKKIRFQNDIFRRNNF